MSRIIIIGINPNLNEIHHSTYQQFFDDTSFTSRLIRLIARNRSSIVVIIDVIDVIAHIVKR